MLMTRRCFLCLESHFVTEQEKNIIHSWIQSDQSLRFFLYKMKNELRQIINLLKFSNCNTVKWSILQKVKSNSQYNTLILSANRMIWYKLIGFNENYSWATYQLQNYEVRSFQFLTIWMRLEWTQSILSSVSSTPRKKTTWSVKFHDFQKHNITWDTIQWKCRKDDISRRTAWFARTRILQKKNIHYSWVYWSRLRDT